ncbi:hypothetical protein F4779DRAFT_631492 [Xylariaceae sp. FL0662B]|nr:hypothetical protein F4779DRAFT_631492 [Xylariaceae sp. FL0662B]
MPNPSTRNVRGGGGDSSIRTSRVRGQPPSGTSRNSSARTSSSLYYNDYLQPQTHQTQQGSNTSSYGSLGLHSTASRFSLNEQFAATRREFEFGYDDASSILERSTIASQPLGEHAAEDTAGADTATAKAGYAGTQPTVIVDFYDILCVPRHASSQHIRQAYYRLFTLLHPDVQPANLRHVAERYFAAVQTAFETLVDPDRRLEYDVNAREGWHREVDVDGEPQDGGSYRAWRSQLLTIDDDLDTWELGSRIDARDIFDQSRRDHRQGRPRLKPVDFEMSRAFSVRLPALDRAFACDWQAAEIFNLNKLLGRDEDVVEDHQSERSDRNEQSTHLVVNKNFLTIRASVYGFLQDIASLPFPVLLDHYQPSFPVAALRDRSTRLPDGRLYPQVTVKLQHSLSGSEASTRHSEQGYPFPTRSARGDDGAAVVELESDVLPEPTAAVRMSKYLVLPHDSHASLVQLAVKSALWDRRAPMIQSTLQRPTAGGMLLCSVDSGDWRVRAAETCRFFSDFSRINRHFLSLDLPPLYRSPRVELAYKCKSSAFHPSSGILSDRPAVDRGLRGLDWDLDHRRQGSWTVSAAAEPMYQSGSLMYACDVGPRSRQASAKNTSTGVTTGAVAGRRVRVEAELSSNSFWAAYLALRCLRRVGRFSKVGLEVGLSTYSLHLSLYWSRLGQRISLPFLMCSRFALHTRLLFWAALVPFASLAAWDFWGRYVASRHRRRRRPEELDAQSDAGNDVQRRGEADQLTSLMATNVQTRQKGEYFENGLIILSAKYGVKARDNSNAWGVEEVADVTVAVAALVDHGRLYIPKGIRKSNLLGFWDPAPSEEKTLHVRYSYGGREGTVEVTGDNRELILPTPS